MAANRQGPIGSNHMGKTLKKDPPRRVWTADEDDMLLKALKHLVATGWKSDNGFKARYVLKLEEAMKKTFPTANIKATPHITSKLTSWKKNYGSLVTILNRSGVGFNLNGDFKIDFDPDQVDELLKIDSNVDIKFLGKSWPMFDGWKEVFGKDRASGEGAADIIDQLNDMIAQHGTEDVDLNNHENPIDLEENKQGEAADDSVCQSSLRGANTKQSNKKRKGQEIIQNLTYELAELRNDTNARLQSLVDRIGYQVDLCKARKDVFPMLQEIPDLSEDNQFEVAEILVDKPSFLEMFMGLPESAKPAYVYRLLKNKK